MPEAPTSHLQGNSLKDPSMPYHPSSRATADKSGQKYNPVPREWEISTTAVSDKADAQYLSPMERWKKEDLRQSPWNNVASYAALTGTKNVVSERESACENDNWSMGGNAQSEK